MATVELEHVTVGSVNGARLDAVNIAVADGELIGVIGASGAGKTTLLRVIAGLETVTAGVIRVDGIDVTQVPPAQRDVAMVSQTPVPLPRRDVRRNIAFPLEIRHKGAVEIDTRVVAESRALHIEALLGRSPRTLSAGEAQIVQIARALVRKPSMLLLDEPLARMDATLAQRMRLELRSVQEGYGVTTFLATNDPAEAMSMCDRLVVLDAGRVVQVGRPIDVYDQPATLVAAACTGSVSVLTVSVEADAEGFWLVHPSFRRRAWRPSLADHVAGSVAVAMRPRWLRLADDGPITATVTDISPVAGTVTAALGPSAGDGEVEIAANTTFHRHGDQLRFHIDELALFDPASGRHLE